MSIIDCVVSNVILATGLAAMAVCLGRISTRPQITHVLWILVLVKLVTPPLVRIPVNHPFVATEVAASPGESATELESGLVSSNITEPQEHHGRSEASGTALPEVPVLPSAARKTPGTEVGSPPFIAQVPWFKVLLGVWGVGTLLWFTLAAVRLFRFRKMLQYAHPASEKLESQIRAVADRYGLRSIPEILVVDAKVPPMMWAFGRRARMVLPSGLLGTMGQDEQAGLIAHELAHLKRRDHWIRWFEFVVLGVYWWNPIAWWARANIQQAEEECCDAWVLSIFPGKGCLYAQTLVETIDYLDGSTQWKPEMATAFNQGHSLKRRIEMIVREKTCRSLSWKMRTALLVMAVTVSPVSFFGSGAARSSEEPPPQSGKTIPRASSDGSKTPEETITIQGRVLGPDGRPFEGATIYAQTEYESNVRRRSPDRATTKKDGTFRFTVARSEFSALWGDQPIQRAPVIAVAEGYGPDWGNGLEKDGVTLRLVEGGMPIEGRIVDDEGRPVKDAQVSVLQIGTPRNEDLNAWVEALKGAKEACTLESRFLGKRASMNLLGNILPPRKTGANGRFVLKDVGDERIVTLRVEGPDVETSIINVATRPLDRVEVPYYREAPTLGTSIYHGATFEHRARTVKPIVGVVRDKDTGKPLSGVRLRGWHALGGCTLMQWAETTSDAQGRYRLTGLPRRGRVRVLAIPPDDQPYMPSQLKVEDSPKSRETTLDFALKRGLWIEGRVTDSVTKEPVKGAAVFYRAFSDNPHAKESPGLWEAFRGWIAPYYITPDGSFRRVGLPGQGLIAVRVPMSDRYRFGLGADKIKGGEAMQGVVNFPTVPMPSCSATFNAMVEVNPREDQDRYECNVALDPGPTITGEVLDPDGRPLTGALVWGARSFGGRWAHEPLSGSTFQVEAYDPGKPRYLFFLHKGRRLAGSLTVRGENPGKLTVQLQPWAVVSGRLLDAEGKPKGGVEILSHLSWKQDPTAGTPINGGPLPPGDKYASNHTYNDDDGRFLIEGLVPGVNYDVNAADSRDHTFAHILEDTVLKPGETRSVGDVRLRKMSN